jgi:hypothetical protein
VRSIPIQILQVLHHWAAVAYMTTRGIFCHGWYEAFEHSAAPVEQTVCPVKQMIGISFHDKQQ